MRLRSIAQSFFLCLFALASDSLAQDKIFWSETVPLGNGSVSAIKSANLDGTSPQGLLGNPLYSPILDLAVDSLNSKIYRIDTLGNRIVRSNLDGLNLEIMQSGLGGAAGLALDPARQQLYWTTPANGTISRCSYAPLSAIEVVLPSGANNSPGLDLDVRARKIYWTQTNGTVHRANYDGSEVETVATIAGINTAPFGIAFDRNLQRIFFSLPISLASEFIAFKNINPLTPLSGSFQVPSEAFLINHLVVDPHPSGRLYWTHTGPGAVSSSLKDQKGNDQKLLVNGASSRGIDLFLGCDAFSTDTDGDGTPDCSEQCALDFNKLMPGGCGCGLLDLDTDADGVLDCTDQCPDDENKSSPGVCGCGEFDNLRTASKLTCDDAPLLDENTKLTEGPEIFVSVDANGNPIVRIVFKRFIAARSIRLLKRHGLSAATFGVTLPASTRNKKLNLRYDARLRVEGSAAKNIARYIVKRNELTLRNLKPGSYSVRYRALGLKDGKTVIKSNFSPKSSFTVP